MKFVKSQYHERLIYIIENDKHMANNFLEDNNKIGSILAIGHLVKSTRLILLIFNFSYFIGMIWMLATE